MNRRGDSKSTRAAYQADVRKGMREIPDLEAWLASNHPFKAFFEDGPSGA